MNLYAQCFICREWSWDVSRCWSGVGLCIPCYVDVLEVRQGRGAVAEPVVEKELGEGPDQQPPFLQVEVLPLFGTDYPPNRAHRESQVEMFEPRERYR